MQYDTWHNAGSEFSELQVLSSREIDGENEDESTLGLTDPDNRISRDSVSDAFKIR